MELCTAVLSQKAVYLLTLQVAIPQMASKLFAETPFYHNFFSKYACALQSEMAVSSYYNGMDGIMHKWANPH